MEESWIDLNVQQAKVNKTASQDEDETQEVISAPSTDSQSSSSSTSSLAKQGLTSSGTTDENLSASFGTLLRKREVDATMAAKSDSSGTSEEAERERRDTITAKDRPKEVSDERKRARQQRRRKREQAVEASYWQGFYSGITVGVSALIFGIACWKLSMRLHNFGSHR